MQKEDINAIRKKVCNAANQSEIQISVDAMTETKSTSVSMDVYSSKLPNCKAIFPHKIVRPLRKYPVDAKEQFSDFIHELTENQMRILQYIADNLKRATGKNHLCHSSAYPCDYCYAKGVRFQKNTTAASSQTRQNFNSIREHLRNLNDNDMDDENINLIQEKINETEKKITSKKSHIVWPFSTYDAGEPRTVEAIENIVEKIENGERLTPDEAKGVVGRSPLMNLSNFDMVRDSPAEYLHSVCIGVSKRLLELTFRVGEPRSRITTRKLSDPLQYNRLMIGVLVPREFSRRIRELDYSVMKGQEFRNVILFFFVNVVKCIPDKDKERKLWLLFAFMIRACILPNQEFKQISLSLLENTCKMFYKLYTELYGPTNCTYNTHVVCTHLIEMRFHGPLTFTSAFAFESFYGEIRNAFIPGTQSPLTQIFKKNTFDTITGLPLLPKFDILQRSQHSTGKQHSDILLQRSITQVLQDH